MRPASRPAVLPAAAGPCRPEDFLFITGATGPTGLRAVHRLLDEGWRLRCLTRGGDAARYLPDDPRLRVVRGDLTQSGDWMGEVAHSAAVLHLAHIGLAASTLEACRRHGAERLICLSSTRRFTRFPEESARRVIAGEDAVTRSDLRYTILRPTMIYGANRDNNVGRIAAWLKRRSWMPLVRGGRNLVQPVHTDDVVEAIWKAIVRPEETARRAIDLAGPEPITWRAMVEAVAESTGKKVRWIPVPWAAALFAAWVSESMPGGPAATPDQVRRLLEDKAFPIDEARDLLGGWNPRSFSGGLRLQSNP